MSAPKASKKRKVRSEGNDDAPAPPNPLGMLESEKDARPNSTNLTSKKLEKMKEKYEKRGIVYISRLPPHMKPQKLRHMLEQHAPLGRLYLAPEDPLARKKRKQRGGNSGKNFTEGWVEFEDKADAKRVAAALNGQPMGGRRRSAHYYDLWCLKYLPKFKWDHLTEEINYQKAIKDQKLTAEVAAAKRERDFYLSRVDKAKAVDAIVERKKKREQQEQQQQQRIQHGEGSSGGDGGIQNDGSGAGQHRDTVALRVESAGEHGEMPHGPRILRTYGQRKAKADPVTDAAAPALSRGVLEMIAGKRKENEGR